MHAIGLFLPAKVQRRIPNCHSCLCFWPWVFLSDAFIPNEIQGVALAWEVTRVHWEECSASGSWRERSVIGRDE